MVERSPLLSLLPSSAYSFFDGTFCLPGLLYLETAEISLASDGEREADEENEVEVRWRDGGGVGQELSGLVKADASVSLLTTVFGLLVFRVWFRLIFFDSASIVRWRGLADVAADAAVTVDSTGDGRSAWLSEPSTNDDGDDEEEAQK